ncbi:MAG: hypothetical protein Q8Q15_01360 [bacterium]|nr:hypothetical protein [bacterium]
MFKEGLEQAYYHAIGIEEFSGLNPLAVGLLIAKSKKHARQHHSIIEGHPLPPTGAAIFTANHHLEADTYKGILAGLTVGRVIRPVLRKSLIHRDSEESKEFLESIGNKQDKLNKYSPLRAFVLRGIGAIGIMRDNPGQDWIRPSRKTLKNGLLLSAFLQLTRHKDGCLRNLQNGAAYLMTKFPDTPTYTMALSGGLPDEPDKAVASAPITYNEKKLEYGRDLEIDELTIILADIIAENLPERPKQHWLATREEEAERLRSNRLVSSRRR